MEIQMVRAVPFFIFRKRWVDIWLAPLFLLFSVFPVGAHTICQFSKWACQFFYAREKMADKVDDEGDIK